MPVSIGFCKPTLRGIARTEPRKSWYVERMLSRYFPLEISDEPDFLFFGDVGNGEHLLYPSSTIRIFITGENVQADWSVADFACTHERLYSERHWRVPLHRHWYDMRESHPTRDFGVVKNRVTRFCNFIYSNERATERIDFFECLSRYKQVDSGGGVRNNIGARVDDKAAFMQSSKFTIAFENESHDGYSTEKILQPLLHGSIPIYWGDPSIDIDFNPDCFVNVHRFPSYDAVVDEIRRIDEDDALWERYVTAPIFRNDTIPDELSDAAIVKFFDGIFSSRHGHVTRLAKVRQRIERMVRAG